MAGGAGPFRADDIEADEEPDGIRPYTFGTDTIRTLSRRTRLSLYRLLGIPLVLLLVLAVHPWSYLHSSDSGSSGPYYSGGDQFPGVTDTATGDPSGGDATDTVPVDPATTTADDGASEAAALDQILDSATEARQSVATAFADIGNCGADSTLSGDAETLQQASSTRTSLVDQIGELSMDSVDGGVQAAQDLSTALTDSAEADDDYASWATALDTGGSCDPATADQDSNFQAGADDSTKATTDKETFVAEWAAIAETYGLQSRTSDSF